MADTDDELHAFAARMGMRREWFQDKAGRPHQAHYDVPERARPEALALGAVEVTWRQVGRMMRARTAGSDAGRGRRPALSPVSPRSPLEVLARSPDPGAGRGGDRRRTTPRRWS